MEAFLTGEFARVDSQSVSFSLTPLHLARMEALFDGTFACGDPRIAVLDEIVSGTFLQSSSRSPARHHLYQGSSDGQQAGQHFRRGMALVEESFEHGSSLSSNVPLNTVREVPTEAICHGTNHPLIHGDNEGGRTGSRRTRGEFPLSTSAPAAVAAAPSLMRKRIDDSLPALDAPGYRVRRELNQKSQEKSVAVVASEDSSGLESVYGVVTVHPTSVSGAKIGAEIWAKIVEVVPPRTNGDDPSNSRAFFPLETLEQASKSLEVRGSGQGKPRQAVKERSSLNSGSGDKLLASSGDSQLNSSCLISLVNTGEREFDERSLPASQTWRQNDPQLLVSGTLVVDISPNYRPMSVSTQITL